MYLPNSRAGVVWGVACDCAVGGAKDMCLELLPCTWGVVFGNVLEVELTTLAASPVAVVW